MVLNPTLVILIDSATYLGGRRNGDETGVDRLTDNLAERIVSNPDLREELTRGELTREELRGTDSGADPLLSCHHRGVGDYCTKSGMAKCNPTFKSTSGHIILPASWREWFARMLTS